MSKATRVIIDEARRGTKGFPLHAEALGIEPLTKVVPVENGVPQPEHPGLNPIEVYRLEIQALIDSKAQEKQYDSGATLASYVNSTIPKWASEAELFIAWRDSVWLYALVELDKVVNGEREQPSLEDFLNELPKLNWDEENDNE